MGNRPSLYRVLQNLIGNAIKFTHQGSIDIHIKLYETLPSKDVTIQIVVEDTGIGIPHNKQRIVFENLRRLTPSHQGLYEGSGIGLYLVDKFVKAMAGKIYLESKENKGSKFTLALPFKVPLIVENTPHEKNEQAVLNTDNNFPTQEVYSRDVSPTQPIFILLVEDNQIAQKMTRHLLESLGYHVDIANNGEEALQLLGQKRYDLVYMDVGLPDIDGCEVTRRWRKKEDSRYYPLPIVALTAHAGLSEVTQCLESGMNAVLSKPLLAKQATQLIDQLIYHKPVEVEGYSGPLNLDHELR